MVAYVKVSVVRKSLANCGVRVQIPLEVLVHNCFCYTLKHSLTSFLKTKVNNKLCYTSSF